MRLDTHEFIRRFMLHELPPGPHRIRHFDLLASRPKLALARKLLDAPSPEVLETSAKDESEVAVFNFRKCQPSFGDNGDEQSRILASRPAESRSKMILNIHNSTIVTLQQT